MGIKTVGNDLDNAWISFDDVELPRSALLARYAEVEASQPHGKPLAATRTVGRAPRALLQTCHSDARRIPNNSCNPLGR